MSRRDNLRRCILFDATRPGTPPWHEAVVFMPKGVGRGVNQATDIRTVLGCTDEGLRRSEDARCKAGSANERVQRSCAHFLPYASHPGSAGLADPVRIGACIDSVPEPFPGENRPQSQHLVHLILC